MKPFFLFAFVMLCLAGRGQSKRNFDQQRDSLYYRQSFLQIHPNVMNRGNKLTKQEQYDIFSRVPASMEWYRKYRKEYRKGIYALAGVFVFTALSVVSFDHGNRPLTAAGLTLTIGSFVTQVIFFSRGEARLKKAIRAFNHSHF